MLVFYNDLRSAEKIKVKSCQLKTSCKGDKSNWKCVYRFAVILLQTSPFEGKILWQLPAAICLCSKQQRRSDVKSGGRGQ